MSVAAAVLLLSCRSVVEFRDRKGSSLKTFAALEL